MLKKTTIAVTGLIASTALWAGAMGPVCAPSNVTTSCEVNHWSFGLQALYLNTIYGANKGLELAGPFIYNQALNDWNWGFKAEGAYHYNMGSDITLDWTHYTSDISQTGFQGFIPIPPTFSSSFALAAKNRFDQVDLVWGQKIDFGLVKKMRFFGGFQYVNIQTDSTNFYPSTLVSLHPRTFSTLSLLDNADFKGLGPVLGIDYSYDLTPAFSLTAKGSGSLVYGTSRYNLNYVIDTLGAVLPQAYLAKKAVIPSLEAKLGVNYAYIMDLYTVNLEAGYQVLNYFNVLQLQTFQSAANPISTTDYALYGPYFGIKLLGNI